MGIRLTPFSLRRNGKLIFPAVAGYDVQLAVLHKLCFASHRVDHALADLAMNELVRLELHRIFVRLRFFHLLQPVGLAQRHLALKGWTLIVKILLRPCVRLRVNLAPLYLQRFWQMLRRLWRCALHFILIKHDSSLSVGFVLLVSRPNFAATRKKLNQRLAVHAPAAIGFPTFDVTALYKTDDCAGAAT